MINWHKREPTQLEPVQIHTHINIIIFTLFLWYKSTIHPSPTNFFSPHSMSLYRCHRMCLLVVPTNFIFAAWTLENRSIRFVPKSINQSLWPRQWSYHTIINQLEKPFHCRELFHYAEMTVLSHNSETTSRLTQWNILPLQTSSYPLPLFPYMRREDDILLFICFRRF